MEVAATGGGEEDGCQRRRQLPVPEQTQSGQRIRVPTVEGSTAAEADLGRLPSPFTTTLEPNSKALIQDNSLESRSWAGLRQNRRRRKQDAYIVQRISALPSVSIGQ